MSQLCWNFLLPLSATQINKGNFMNRGLNEKRFLALVGVPEWCGESDAREALYGALADLIESVEGVGDSDAPVIDSPQSDVTVPAGKVETQGKAVSGRVKGKPGRKRKVKK